jgi:hypothetical protein
MALDDKLRAIRTEDPSKKRAFDQAADEWLKLAEYVEKLERERANYHRRRTTAQPERVGAGHCATGYRPSNQLLLAPPVLHREPSVMRRP